MLRLVEAPALAPVLESEPPELIRDGCGPSCNICRGPLRGSVNGW